MYFVIPSILFFSLFFYSSTDDQEKYNNPPTPSPTCPPDGTPFVYRNLKYERVNFGDCYGIGFLPPKHIEIEIEKHDMYFLITLFGSNEWGSEEGYFYLEFSTNGNKIYVTPGFDVIDFKTENNFKLDFFALQNNTIKVVITNPNEESYEYIHYAERDLRNLSAVLYGGDHVLKKVTLLKDGYVSE
uniref:Uncharacterized protein n=1 Tax=Meloidogyne enterolobii TaxID=390850 RepID=A0A6V7TTD7_MELEN|nr:unnamed protein product [Meloidogyne enterolobii]